MTRAALLVLVTLATGGGAAFAGGVIVLPGSPSGSSSYRVPSRPTPAPVRPKPAPTASPTPFAFQPVSPMLPFSPTPFASRITVVRKSDVLVEVRAPALAISNVVLEFADGTRQRYEDVGVHTASFGGSGSHAGKPIAVVWVKSGPNFSGDGPGYGQRFNLAAAGK